MMVHRYCCRPNEKALCDSEGYLVDPETATASYHKTAAIAISDLDNKDALVLLGEPGIGKTTALMMMSERAREKKESQVIFIDLKDVESAADLRIAIGVNPDNDNHVQEDRAVELFLDSLDEFNERQKLAVKWIGELLEVLALSCTCRVHICCRTACWPALLQERVVKLYGSIELQELLPFRKADVASLTRSKLSDCESAQFMKYIEDKHLGAIASRPLTLQMLLNIWGDGLGALSITRVELFEMGLKVLCMEHNETYRGRDEISNRSTEELLCIASRIAAFMLLCRRSTVLKPVDEPLASPHDAVYSELAGNENLGRGPFRINQGDFKDALDTGLFTSRGEGRLGWAHRSFQEYLAAKYLTAKKCPPGQMLGLLTSPDDSRGRIAPQLSGVSGWLATMDEAFREELLAKEPLALLSCDPTFLSDGDKSEIFSELFRQLERSELFEINHNVIKDLGFPGLIEMIRPILADDTKGDVLRRNALDIAVECGLTDLADLLVGKALDQNCSSQIRAGCINALIKMNCKESLRSLGQLVGSRKEPDPDDEILGHAILGLWPGMIDSTLLFKAITPPKNKNFFGSYLHALKYFLPMNLGVDSLSSGLQWLLDLSEDAFSNDSLSEIMTCLIGLALDHMEEENTQELLGAVISRRIKVLHTVLPEALQIKAKEAFSAFPERRRNLALKVIEHSLTESRLLFELLTGMNALVKSEDLKWLLSSFAAAPSIDWQRAMMKLILWVADLRNARVRSEVEKTLLGSSIRSEAQEWLDAHDKRVSDSIHSSPRGRSPKRQKSNAKTVSDLTTLVDQATSFSAWPQVLGEILEQDGAKWNAMRFMIGDLKESPHFKVLSETQRIAVLDLAESYSVELDAHEFDPHGFRRFSYAEISLYYAVLLMASDGRMRSLQKNRALLIKKWAKSILKLHPLNGDDRVREDLVRTLVRVAPRKIVNIIEEEIQLEYSEMIPTIPIENIRLAWNPLLEKMCLRLLRDPKTPVEIAAQILHELCLQNSGPAVRWAESRIGRKHNRNDADRLRAKVAAIELLQKSPVAYWAMVWEVVQNDDGFGKELLQSIAHRSHDHRELLETLDDTSLGELYRWLIESFPPADDPKYEGAHSVTKRDSAAEFRDSIPRYLASRCTTSANCILGSLAESFPDDLRLKWLLAESRVKTLDSTWDSMEPFSATQFFDLIDDDKKRFISSEAMLVQVILDLLDDLQNRLQANTPAARFLWNSDGKTCWPKSEGDFSDFVKFYLEERLRNHQVIVNREVQIRRGMGDTVGQRTDIHVDLIPPLGRRDHFIVIIECKGCWNDELLTGMKTQLLDRYMVTSGNRTGVYLVGLFDCTSWNKPRDSRKHKHHSISELQSALLEQAGGLSSTDISISAKVLNCAIE